MFYHHLNVTVAWSRHWNSP